MDALLVFSSYNSAVSDLAATVNPAEFESKFGSSVENLSQLVDTKTVTIGKWYRQMAGRGI